MEDDVSLLSLVNWSWLHLLIPIAAVLSVVELRRSARNDEYLRRRGAVEFVADQHAAFVALHVVWLVAMVAEIILLSRQVVRFWPELLGLLFLAEATRTWSIAALGRHFSLRVLVIPRSLPNDTGPYRWIRHPYYLATGIELAALPLMLGAVVTGIAVTVINGVMIRKRIAAEERAFAEIGGRRQTREEQTTTKAPQRRTHQ